MLEQSQLLSEAHFAIEHVGRLKRLARQRSVGRRLQRRVRALENAACEWSWRRGLNLSVAGEVTTRRGQAPGSSTQTRPLSEGDDK
jgi:hypothetical protein